MRFAPIALGTAVAVGLAASPALGTDLAMPESVLVHRGQTYVSQIGAAGNNDGSIARVNRRGNVTGTVVQGGGATTLVDPKGLAAIGNQICATDVTAVRCYDRNTGAPGIVVNPPGASFLNDLVDKGGAYWASDTRANAIYRIATTGAVRRIGLPRRFSAPNGLVVHPRTRELWIVTTPGSPGAEIVRRRANGRLVLVKADRRLRGLDGIVFVGSSAFVTDFLTGRLWRLDARGRLTQRARLPGSPADLDFHPGLRRLIIPQLAAGHLLYRRP